MLHIKFYVFSVSIYIIDLNQLLAGEEPTCDARAQSVDRASVLNQEHTSRPEIYEFKWESVRILMIGFGVKLTLPSWFVTMWNKYAPASSFHNAFCLAVF